MALELTILVGTMTGIAQLVAQEIELRLDGEGVRIDTKLMDELDAGVFAGGGIVPDLHARPTARETCRTMRSNSTNPCRPRGPTCPASAMASSRWAT